MKNSQIKFSDLKIGDTFDFIDPDNAGYNSFFKRCRKISCRKYAILFGDNCEIGYVHCPVYHVNEN